MGGGGGIDRGVQVTKYDVSVVSVASRECPVCGVAPSPVSSSARARRGADSTRDCPSRASRPATSATDTACTHADLLRGDGECRVSRVVVSTCVVAVGSLGRVSGVARGRDVLAALKRSRREPRGDTRRPRTFHTRPPSHASPLTRVARSSRVGSPDPVGSLLCVVAVHA